MPPNGAWKTGSSGSGHHRPEPVGAAEVVRAVHGASASPVPIIESRVTRSASASSDIPSVAAGCIGTTR